MNFPSRHPLAGSGGQGYQPDVTLCLEVADISGGPHGDRARERQGHQYHRAFLFHKSNIQDSGTMPTSISISARTPKPRCRRSSKLARSRSPPIASAHSRSAAPSWPKRTRRRGTTRSEQARVWLGLEPHQPGPLCAELWPLIKNEDWSLVSWQGFISNWPNRLWKFDKHYQYIGGQGAGGMGYGAPAAVGAALANRKHGRSRSIFKPMAISTMRPAFSGLPRIIASRCSPSCTTTAAITRK